MRQVLNALGLLFCALGRVAGAVEVSVEPSIDALILTKCLGCHGSGMRGGLDLREQEAALRGGDSGPVISPGAPEESLLYRYVSSGKMPPDTKLSPDEIGRFREWIQAGAEYANGSMDPFAATTDKRAGYDWWSFQPIHRPEPPKLPADGAMERAWSNNPIDRFVYSGLVAAGLTPSPPASPRTLIRRATYDLTGLPPSPEEVDAFLRACAAETGVEDRVGEQAYSGLLDRLLASLHYGERWGRHWLDVVRFGESSGLEQNYIIDSLWPFRDYVIKSFNDDKPFDQFVLEQLAGDVIAPGDPEVEIGIAFLVCGAFDSVNNRDPVQAAQIEANSVDEMIRATSESFLGLTLGCARCHDHKFDPLAQRDYYQLYASLAGISHGERPITTPAMEAARREKLKPLEEEKRQLIEAQRRTEGAILKRAEARAEEFETQWTRPPIVRTGAEERFPPVAARFVRLISEGRDTNPYEATGYRIDEFEAFTGELEPRNVALAAAGGSASGASREAEDFAGAYGAECTIDGEFGVTWLALGDALSIAFDREYTIERVRFSSDRHGVLGDHGLTTFLAEYRLEVSRDGQDWTEVANSHDRKPVNDSHRRKRLLEGERTAAEAESLAGLEASLRKVQHEIAAVPEPERYWVGEQRPPGEDFHIFLGGDPQRPGESVVPGSVIAASTKDNTYALPADASSQERRLRLAEWIVSKENPLTPRVLANRLWHYHFGTGIVATPSDFGFMGGRPSNPDLLDWLAIELLEPSGGEAWQLKRMHRLIMLSQCYRQGSVYRAEAAAIDADARLLWRFPPRRLTAEAVRDTMLAVAGKLDPAMGGPGFRLYKYARDNVATYFPLDEHGADTFRRAVYHQTARASRMDLLSEFDAPECALAAPRRETTTSPLQALTLMNHSFTLDMAAALAARLEREAGRAEERAARAFALCFAREPRPEETAVSAALIEAHGLRAFCRGMFNLNEFVYLQ